jgi:predicted metal-dependent peptidase
MMGEDFTDKEVFNIAADIEINQYINDDELPEGGLTLNTFPELSLPPNAGTRAYYNILLNAAQNNKSPLLSRMLDSMKNGSEEIYLDGNLLPDHSSWEEFSELSDSEKKLIKNQLKYNMQQLADEVKKSRGSIPSEISSILSGFEVKEAPKFDWKGYLRRFVGNSNKVYTKKLKRKFNRRFEDNPGLKIKKRQHVLLAVDTSGSVSTAELMEFFSEIDHISKTGVDITVVQCDAAISSIGTYKSGMEIKIHGRGGTRFEPVIEYYDANHRKYTCLIYFTDGEAAIPEKPRGRNLWVLSERSRMNESLPGQVIKLNK